MNQNRRERKKSATREKLAAAAYELFKSQGYHSTSIDQITETADVGRGTFYNHFPSKEAIVPYLIDWETDMAREREWPHILGLPDVREQLAYSLRGWCAWVEANRDLVEVYLRVTVADQVWEATRYSDENGFERYVGQIIALGQESGEIRHRARAQDLARYLTAMLFVPLVRWHLEPGFILAEGAAEVLDVFLAGAVGAGPSSSGVSSSRPSSPGITISDTEQQAV